MDEKKCFRSKKIHNMDSLKCTKMRLDTFIEWPVPWLKPLDLAIDGLYYLRSTDHCACAYCYSVIFAWIIGDTPRSRHKLICPDCPFITGYICENVPLEISKLTFQYGLEFVSRRIKQQNINIQSTNVEYDCRKYVFFIYIFFWGEKKVKKKSTIKLLLYLIKYNGWFFSIYI
ncbi:Apoptosis inhibitor IAP [Astathelohania contejeani]|uniref:Apoptosis inhibitor IAP n=1 Tax=Astathelohania contejeani TaxID=164912 RepID=A0ABQ7HVF3_9MICR|nr:Apoptosis inhibitor IAP [Thelohania contejeani]